MRKLKARQLACAEVGVSKSDCGLRKLAIVPAVDEFVDVVGALDGVSDLESVGVVGLGWLGSFFSSWPAWPISFRPGSIMPLVETRVNWTESGLEWIHGCEG